MTAAADLIWSLVARTGPDNLDEDPQVTIERTEASMAAGLYPGGLAGLYDEVGVPRSVDPALMAASAAAGRARWALVERDRAIRAATAAGWSLRQVGEATGLSHTTVATITHRGDDT